MVLASCFLSFSTSCFRYLLSSQSGTWHYSDFICPVRPHRRQMNLNFNVFPSGFPELYLWCEPVIIWINRQTNVISPLIFDYLTGPWKSQCSVFQRYWSLKLQRKILIHLGKLITNNLAFLFLSLSHRYMELMSLSNQEVRKGWSGPYLYSFST